LFQGDVGLDEEGAAAYLLNLLAQQFCLPLGSTSLLPIVNDHVGAGLSKFSGNGIADATGTARDQNNFIPESIPFHNLTNFIEN
jgi:hypothetical protein